MTFMTPLQKDCAQKISIVLIDTVKHWWIGSGVIILVSTGTQFNFRKWVDLSMLNPVSHPPLEMREGILKTISVLKAFGRGWKGINRGQYSGAGGRSTASRATASHSPSRHWVLWKFLVFSDHTGLFLVLQFPSQRRADWRLTSHCKLGFSLRVNGRI